MRKIRSCITAVCFAIFGAGSLVLGSGIFPFLLLLPKTLRRRVALFFNRLTWRIFIGLVCALRMISVRREHAERLSRTRGAVIVANHPTLIDVVLLLAYAPDTLCVVKTALLKNVFLRGVVRVAHLSNDLPPNVFFDEAQALLKQGFNILIFPEGTRTRPGCVPALHRGAAQLALSANATILPVKISVNPQILGKHQAWWDLGERCVEFRLRVSEPIKTDAVNRFPENRHIRAKRLTEILRSKLFDPH